MKAVILAAGRGSRMKELTKEKPKCLVDLNGKTLLERQISSLRSAGIDEVAIVTGYRSECLTQYGLHEFHNDNWENTNMVSSLLCAEEWLTDSDCIISYSDIFYTSNTVKALIHCENSIGITYDPHWLRLWKRRFKNPLDDAENFKLGSDGFLLDIGGRAKDVESIQGQYMGLIKFSPIAWVAIRRYISMLTLVDISSLDMTTLLKKLLQVTTLRIKTIPCSGAWGEVDSLSDLDVYKEVVHSD